jgi:hypothetical protein
MRGAQPIECNPQPWGFEKGAHSNIKADKAAIVKRRIYLPHTSLKRDFLLFCQFRCLKSSPHGRRENIAGLRIQTAAKGVNDFVKAMRLPAGPHGQ